MTLIRRCGSRSKAFSLIELLVVLAIIGILAAIAIPALNSMSSAPNLTASANQLSAEINLARQTAVTMNSPVEVRFFDIEGGKYTAYASYQVNDDGTLGSAIGKITVLPKEVAMMDSAAYSTLITDAPESGSADIPQHSNVTYAGFRFRSSGSADLDTPSSGSAWTVTLAPRRDIEQAKTPANFATITLIPLTGTTRIDRP